MEYPKEIAVSVVKYRNFSDRSVSNLTEIHDSIIILVRRIESSQGLTKAKLVLDPTGTHYTPEPSKLVLFMLSECHDPVPLHLWTPNMVTHFRDKSYYAIHMPVSVPDSHTVLPRFNYRLNFVRLEVLPMDKTGRAIVNDAANLWVKKFIENRPHGDPLITVEKMYARQFAIYQLSASPLLANQALFNQEQLCDLTVCMHPDLNSFSELPVYAHSCCIEQYPLLMDAFEKSGGTIECKSWNEKRAFNYILAYAHQAVSENIFDDTLYVQREYLKLCIQYQMETAIEYHVSALLTKLDSSTWHQYFTGPENMALYKHLPKHIQERVLKSFKSFIVADLTVLLCDKRFLTFLGAGIRKKNFIAEFFLESLSDYMLVHG